MKLIVCFDKNYGVLFGRKRVSTDKYVIQDILKICEEDILNVSEYTSHLFNTPNINVIGSVSQAEKGYLFVEDFIEEVDFADYDEIITYNWGISYPVSVTLTPEQKTALEHFEISEQYKMKGFSHPEITFTHYLNEEPFNQEEEVKQTFLARFKKLFKVGD